MRIKRIYANTSQLLSLEYGSAFEHPEHGICIKGDDNLNDSTYTCINLQTGKVVRFVCTEKVTPLPDANLVV